MGKRKLRSTSQPVTAAAAKVSFAPAPLKQPPSSTLAQARQQRKVVPSSSSSSSSDEDGPLLSKRPSHPPSLPQPSSTPLVVASSPAEAADDDSDDDLGVNIIERPSGYTSPSHPPTSPSHPSSSSSSSSSGSDSDDSAPTLRINRAFAQKFEAEKRQQELSKKAQRGKRKSDILALVQHQLHTLSASPTSPDHGSSEEEGEEEGEEDEDEEEDDDGELLTDALDVKIHQTLNAIRRRDPAVYDPSTVFFHEEDGDASPPSHAGTAPTKVTVKDLLLESITHTNGDDEDDEEEEEDGERGGVRPLTHVEEQAQLKADLLKATQEEEADENDDDELFKVRITAPPVSTSSSSPSIDAPLPPDQFLHSFLSNQWWKAAPSTLPSYAAIKGEPPPPLLHPTSDDDLEVEKADVFESLYNQSSTFHYQEEGSHAVHTWPRDVPDSLRRKDTRRREERERRKARQAEDRRRRDEEVKKAKAEKMREVREKMREIQRVAALAEEKGEEVDMKLEGEFNEEEHQQLMSRLFDEEYYAQDHDDGDVPSQVREGDEDGEGREEGEEGKGSQRSVRPLSFAPSSVRQLQRGLDEVYALEYEDVIGDLPTRFHYAKVKPDTFGLSLRDIIDREDRELNAKVSMKKMAPYRAEGDREEDVTNKKTAHNRFNRYHTAARPSQPRPQRKRGPAAAAVTPSKQKKGKEGKEKTAAAVTAKVAGDGEKEGAQGKLTASQRRRLREKKRKALQSTEESNKRVKTDE